MHKAEFAILGAGAIGSIIGAHLARAGCDVVMLARGRRARQIRDEGLKVTGLQEFSQAVAVLTEPEQLRSAGVLVVATKTHGTAAALAPLRDAAIGCAFSIQNGLIKNELLAACFGPAQVLGSIANISGELLPAGEVVFTRNVNLSVGELGGGFSARAQRIAHTLDASGVRATAVADIESLEWSKFASWLAMMVLSVTTRAVTWKFLVDADSALVSARIVREVGRLADAGRQALTDDSVLPVATICRVTEGEAVAAIQRIGAELRAKAPQHRMSTLQDLEAGRPLEIEETLGWAVRRARQSMLSLPLLELLHPLVSAMDRIRSAAAAAPS